ncbi:MAG: ARMT1-like domain-containing protein [Planctomycetota bacterium]|jgi:uncharacterized protein with ATP-grasp and redox domains|nr:ARMT1-like domain-containing protein [Planctomycetota bacterium]
MKAIPDCVPEALAMILAAARAVSEDDFIHRKVLLKVMGEIAEDGDLGANPAELYLQCWDSACRALGVRDPYENEKARRNKTALGILKMLAERFASGQDDRLGRAIRFSLAGAMLDFGGLGRTDIQEDAAANFLRPPAPDESAALEAAIAKADSLMLVANRAGEIVLDRPLAEAAAAKGKRVFLTVAAKPVFLLATRKDAELAGFPAEVEVVDPGTPMFGLAPERASSEFRELLSRVDLLIAKGDTNWGTMTSDHPRFFILKAGDPALAESLGTGLNEGAVFRATPAKK